LERVSLVLEKNRGLRGSYPGGQFWGGGKKGPRLVGKVYKEILWEQRLDTYVFSFLVCSGGNWEKKGKKIRGGVRGTKQEKIIEA